MTRKDYILIAEVLRVERHNSLLALKARQSANEETGFESGHLSGIDVLAASMADSLTRDNSRFDPQHFLAVVNGEKDLNSRPGQRITIASCPNCARRGTVIFVSNQYACVGCNWVLDPQPARNGCAS